MRRTIICVAALMAVSGTPAAAELPMRTTVLSGKDRAAVLRQCSRSTPDAGSGWFKPSAAQIAALDRAAAARYDGRGRVLRVRGAGDLARRFAVEVVGIVRGGRAYVYGNYYRLDMQEGQKEAYVPTVVCDGGPSFFGVEIDAATGKVTHYATNGR
jgi:hypothetical protein